MIIVQDIFDLPNLDTKDVTNGFNIHKIQSMKNLIKKYTNM